MVRLHLVDLVLSVRLDIHRVVTSIVHELFFVCDIHDVCAHRVHKIVGVIRGNKDVVIGGEVRLKPDNGARSK